ncbi:MAG: hypothetical protein SFU53_14700 [Terrimicrobiaceae bacterium]|nr:hypothetical protein [Terrimicrobiaceae bacterium]
MFVPLLQVLRARWFHVVIGAAIALHGAACGRKPTAGETSHDLNSAWEQYGYGAYDAALAQFRALAAQTPEADSRHHQALFGEATVWAWRRPGQDPARAERLYRRIMELAPGSDLAGWSALAMARMAWLVPVGQTPDQARVLELLRSAATTFRGQLPGDEALVTEQVIRVSEFDSAEARAVTAALETFLSERPGSPYRAAACGVLSAAARVLDRPRDRLRWEMAAMAEREKMARAIWELDRQGPFVFNDPGALFKIAMIAEFEVGDFAVARDFYTRFLEANPTEKRRFFAEQALERMKSTEDEIRRELVGLVPPGQ